MAHKPTVEELHSNKYNIPEMGEIYLEVLDTSGTFEFPAMRRLSIEKGDAFILVYSVDDQSSWREVCHLRGLILEEKGHFRATSGAPVGPPSGSETSSSGELVSVEPVASIYAAATKLTAANRRTSSSCSLGNKSLGGGPLARRQSIQQQTQTHTQMQQQQIQQSLAPLSAGAANANSPQESMASSVERHATVSSQYSNSQLSRLLSKRNKEGASDDEDEDEDEDEQQREQLRGQENSEAVRDGWSQNGQAELGTPTRSSETAFRRCRGDASGQPREAAALLERASKTPGQQPETVGASGKTGLGRACTPIVVVANKCDLDLSEHQVDSDQAERLVREEWVGFRFEFPVRV